MINKMKRVFVFICVAVIAALSYAESRWQMADDGSIVLSSQALTGYNDHVEMSGKRVSVVLRYAVKDDGSFTVNKGMVWPMLRTVPNNTHASLMRRIEWDLMDNLVINNYRATRDKVERVTLKGTLKAESRMGDAQVTRTWFPSTEQPALIEIMEIKNEGNKDMKVTIPYYNNITLTDPAKGVKGSYAICCMALNPQTVTLKPGEKAEFYGIISGEDGNNVQGSLLNVKWPTANIQCKKELEAREALVAALQDNLVLKTPDEVINRMFAF